MKQRKNFNTYSFLMLALSFLFAPAISQASTGEGEGIIISMNGNSFEWILKRKGFISWQGFEQDNPDGKGHIGDTLRSFGKSAKPQNQTVVLMDGMLTNLNTVNGALDSGKYFYIHNNRSWTQFFSLSNTKNYLEGVIQSVDTANNTFTIEHILKNDNGGAPFGDGPNRVDVQVSFNSSMRFKSEGQQQSPSEVLQVGRHVRVYQNSRKQTFKAFTPEGKKFPYPFYDRGKFGVKKSWVQRGFFRGIIDGKAYFAEYRNGQWINSFKEYDYDDVLVNARIINTQGAMLRQGDRVSFVPYFQPGDGRATKRVFARPRDNGTVEGWITAINGDQVTLKEVVCPTGLAKDVDTVERTITISGDAQFELNGQMGKNRSEALQVGNYVMIKEEWSGAVLARENNKQKMELATQPAVKPYFVSTQIKEIVRGDTLWQQPDTIEVTENRTASFESYPMGNANLVLQWQRDGFKIPGATSMTYERQAQLADDGKPFTLKATTPGGTRISPPIILKVNPDNSPVLLSSAQVVDSSQILLKFNKPVKNGTGPNGAENVANYSIDNGMSINSATLIGDRQTVVLSTSQLSPSTTYTIGASDIHDLSATPNTLPDGASISVDFSVSFRFFRFNVLETEQLTTRVKEFRLIADATTFGEGAAASGEEGGTDAVDGNFSTNVGLKSGESFIVDLGAGNGISPDSLLIFRGTAQGRGLFHYTLEASNDQNNWTKILEDSTHYESESSFKQPIDLSDIDVGDILTGAKQTQTLTFPSIGNKNLEDTPLGFPNVTASSGLQPQLVVISGPAEIGGGISLNDTGRVIIRATQSGNDEFYSAYPVRDTFHVSSDKQSQTITFEDLPAVDIQNADSTVELSATASSGLDVNFEVISGPASLDGTTLMLNGTGTVKVRATQPGNSEFFEASAVTRSFQVTFTTALKELSNAADIRLAPNPSSQKVRISGLKGGQQLQLFNTSGQQIQSLQSTQPTETLSVSKLPSGLYLLRLSDRNGHSTTKKLMVK